MTRSAVRSRLARMVRRGMVARPGGGLALAQIAAAETDLEAYTAYCKWAGIDIRTVVDAPLPVQAPPNLATTLPPPREPTATHRKTLPPAVAVPLSRDWLSVVEDGLPTQDNYYHTFPCPWIDGRGCWFSTSSQSWCHYDEETPAPLVTHYRPMLPPPAVFTLTL